MARKKTEEDREVVLLKLKAVTQYIQDLEEITSRLEIGMIRARALSGDDVVQLTRELCETSPAPEENLPTSERRAAQIPMADDRPPGGPARETSIRVDHYHLGMALCKLSAECLQKPPSQTLIEKDLDDVEKTLGAAYIHEKETAIGVLVESHIDLLVVVQRKNVGLDHEGQAEAVKTLANVAVKSTKAAIALLRARISSATQLRGTLAARLNRDAALATKKGKAKRGRPINPKITRRDMNMLEAWNTRTYPTLAELGQAFDCTADTARKAIGRARRAQKKK